MILKGNMPPQIRTVESMVPKITAIDLEGMLDTEIDLDKYLVSWQDKLEHDFVDSRQCRVCNMVGPRKFSSFMEEMRHRESEEHVKNMEESVKEGIWRCECCNFEPNREDDLRTRKAVFIRHLRTLEH